MTLLDLLGFAGNVLDTPGSWVRNALAGANPFQGTFNPEERTSGRELLEMLGIAGQNQEGLDWGDVGGFGVEMLTDPLGWLPALRAGKLIANPKLAAKVAGIGPEMGVFPPDVIRSLGNVEPRHLEFDEAAKAWEPWVQGLSDAERNALKEYTHSSTTPLIQHVLRGRSTVGSGREVDPFDMGFMGTKPRFSQEQVQTELIPQMDSALSRSRAPTDFMTYRAGGREFAGMTPENVEQMIGKTITEPGYTSTILTPHGRFYGSHPSPEEMNLDIIVREGAPAGLLEQISSYGHTGERELLLPRGSQFKVLGVRDEPIAKLGDYFWDSHRLDPQGRPIPQDTANYLGGGHPSVFTEAAPTRRPGRITETFPQGTFNVDVQDEWLQPGWEQYLQDPSVQRTVLLELLTEQPRRMPPEATLALLLGLGGAGGMALNRMQEQPRGPLLAALMNGEMN